MSEENQSRRVFLALRHLWRRKTLVILGTLGVTVAGLVYSLVAPKIYVSRAIIYPQDVSAVSDKPGFAGLGALSPALGTGHLTRVEIILNSREMARQVLLKNDLYPALFAGNWDPRHGGQDPTTPGNMDSGIRKLQQMVSTRADLYKMTLEISARARDPGTAYRVARAYLDALNERLKANVIRSADENREFLEGQMARTYDPSAKEKIQDLITQQMEKAMFLNANAFELLEAPEVPLLRESPRRKEIVGLSFVAGFLVSVVVVLGMRGFRNLSAETKSISG